MIGKILKLVFLSGIFLSPFIYNPYSPIPYEIPKVWFIKVWIEILIFFVIISSRKIKKKKDKQLIYLVLIYTLIAIISSFTGMDFNKSWVGNYFRGDGLFTFLHLIALFFFIYYFAKIDWIAKMTKLIAISGIILSAASVFIWFLINVLGKYGIETWVDRGIGLSFGNPNFLVGYLIISLPLTVYFLDQLRFRYKGFIEGAVWAIIFFAILLTKAWAGAFGIIVFLLLWILTSENKNKIAKVLLLLVLTLGVVTLFKNQLSSQFGKVNFIELGREGNEFVAEGRGRIYTKAALAFYQRPILGYGWANFDYAFKSVDWPVRISHDVYVDKAHSSTLEVATTLGVLGLIFYLAIILKSLKGFIKDKSLLGRSLLVSFILLILHMQVNIVSISEELIFWVFIAASHREDSV